VTCEVVIGGGHASEPSNVDDLALLKKD